MQNSLDEQKRPGGTAFEEDQEDLWFIDKSLFSPKTVRRTRVQTMTGYQENTVKMNAPGRQTLEGDNSWSRRILTYKYVVVIIADLDGM